MLGVCSLLFTRDWHSHIMEQQEEELEETKGDEELNTPPRPNSVHGVGTAVEHLHLHLSILRIYLHILVRFLSVSGSEKEALEAKFIINLTFLP